MQIWTTLILALQLLSALVMIGLVLIQHGKGADMGASFGGGGSSGSLFGATGSANFLSRSTAACATVFFLSTLFLAFASNSVSGRVSGGSVLDQAAPAASAPGAIPGAIPGSLPGVEMGLSPGAIPGAATSPLAPAAAASAPTIPGQ